MAPLANTFISWLLPRESKLRHIQHASPFHSLGPAVPKDDTYSRILSRSPLISIPDDGTTLAVFLCLCSLYFALLYSVPLLPCSTPPSSRHTLLRVHLSAALAAHRRSVTIHRLSGLCRSFPLSRSDLLCDRSTTLHPAPLPLCALRSGSQQQQSIAESWKPGTEGRILFTNLSERIP